MDISIIIPAYNEENYIEPTLQALDGGEIIVICNGCTDKTKDVAEKYTKKVLVLKEKGVSRARNAGAAVASHPRLIFLDADIRIEKGLLQKIATSPYTVGTSYARADSSYLIDRVLMHIKSQLHRFGYCTGLLFCTQEIFQRVGGFEETVNIREDGIFLRKAKKLGHFGIIQGYVYNNMRRYRKKGYLALALFWLHHYIFPSKKDYESIR